KIDKPLAAMLEVFSFWERLINLESTLTLKHFPIINICHLFVKNRHYIDGVIENYFTCFLKEYEIIIKFSGRIRSILIHVIYAHW
ncbi:MAG: hypothetical protein ACPGUD_07760, partial [Parashewanella sp.]